MLGCQSRQVTVDFRGFLMCLATHLVQVEEEGQEEVNVEVRKKVQGGAAGSAEEGAGGGQGCHQRI